MHHLAPTSDIAHDPTGISDAIGPLIAQTIDRLATPELRAFARRVYAGDTPQEAGAYIGVGAVRAESMWLEMRDELARSATLLAAACLTGHTTARNADWAWPA